MLPTWRDAEIQTEIRKTRRQEARDRQTLDALSMSSRTDLSAYAAALVRLGDWMVGTGERLQSRYSDVGSIENQLRSAEQGC